MRFLKVFSLALLLLFSLASCKKKCGPCGDKETGLSEKFLRISFQSDVHSLDPRIGIDYPSAFAVKMLFEGLFRIGPDGTLQPAVAESYDLSEDHKTYTFHLRPCHWSNGDNLSAHDFVYSWKKVVNPNEDSLGAQNFYPVKNVQEIVRGEKPIDSIGIEALDDQTLRVELEHPTPYFLEVLATSSFFPVNAKWDQEHPGWANQEGAQFVCNGPYTLQKHRIGDEIVVQKNTEHWDVENVSMPGIRIVIIKEPSTQLNLFEKKELEWLGRPFSKMPLDALAHLKQKGKVQFHETLGLYWYFLNVEAFPFSNKKMRQAFAYAVNREVITSHILQGNEIPAQSVLPHSLATQDTPFFPDNNKERALELFDEALEELGITKAELPELTINYAAAPVHMRVAEALQEQWSQVFQINIRLETQDWKAHYGKLRKANFQIGGMGWQSWLRDPIYIMQTFREKADGVNMSQWENKRYQELLAATEQEVDPVKRKELFNEAEALLMDEMPVIPIYFSTIAYAKSSKLKNVYISNLYEADFRWSYFEEDE